MQNSTAWQCEYRYPHASVLNNGQLRLATSLPLGEPAATANSGNKAAAHFFSGRLVRPRQTASLLRGLMNIVRSRFHIPAAMLGRILAESDPVVTCSDDRLRFEGFSACCGAYCRIDLLPDALEGERFCRGTTNVDFNQPMLTALATIRQTDQVSLHVGSDFVQLSRNGDAVVEKKVALPIRWLRGFVEVQACQSRMIPVHEVTGREAMRFLRSMPRMKTNRRETFVVAAGTGLRLAQIAAPHAVRVGGLERLRVLEDLVPDADSLRIYSDEVTGASAWELQFRDCRFHLVISPEVWRGFSGEGQVLAELASDQWNQILPLVRSELCWDAVIDEEVLHRRVAAKADPELAGRLVIDASTIRSALAALGTQGLVGYDLSAGCWFHRELPFDLSAVEKQHPRLKDARRLIADGHVRVASQSNESAEILVQSGDVGHRVRLTADDVKCTCPWFAKHGTSRGPCKHILAAQIHLEGAGDGS